MKVDGFPTTRGSCLVEPRIAPTIDPPPDPIPKVSYFEQLVCFCLAYRKNANSLLTCPFLGIGKMSDGIPVCCKEKAPWILTDT